MTAWSYDRKYKKVSKTLLWIISRDGLFMQPGDSEHPGLRNILDFGTSRIYERPGLQNIPAMRNSQGSGISPDPRISPAQS
jgi:hypothetical protein